MTLGEFRKALEQLEAEGVDDETPIVLQTCTGAWVKPKDIEYKTTHNVVAVYSRER